METMQGPSICAVDINGLLKVVLEHSAGDKGSEYCIDGLSLIGMVNSSPTVSKCSLICVYRLYF